MKLKMLLLAAVAVVSTPAMAVQITYTISGQFTGYLGGAFDVPATFTAVGNTNTLVTTADGSRNVTLSSFTATAPSGQFVFSAPSIRFGTNNGYAGIIFNTDGNNPFVFTSNNLTSYDGVSAVAPISVNYYGSFGGPFTTDRGDAMFSGASNLTFSAALGAVPEPATWGMMLVGFGAMGATMRSRRKFTASFS